jgi:hypothetical protein
VTTVGSEISPNQVVSHVLRYAVEGSQNDVHVTWTDSHLPDPPRLRFYATSTACTDFSPAAADESGDCQSLARAGLIDVHVASTLVITHGRGNPERLGNPPEYKVWVVGDSTRSARYTLDVTWFFGPDC